MKFRRLLSGTFVSAAATTAVVERSTSAAGAVASEFEPARIESVEIDVPEGAPVEYIAHATVIQPNSCAIFGHVQPRYEPPVSIIEAIN